MIFKTSYVFYWVLNTPLQRNVLRNSENSEKPPENSEKPVGIIIDRKFSMLLCDKASKKIQALVWLLSFISFAQRKNNQCIFL